MSLTPGTKVRARGSDVRGEWPFVARRRELDELIAAVREGVTGRGRARGAVIVAPAGAGKTRLAAEVFEWARAHDVRCSWAIGTRSARHTSYAALAHLAPEVLAVDHSDVGALTRAFAKAVSTTSGHRRLLVIDDAQLLDDGSAALVLHLVLTGAVTVVATVRNDEKVPDAITALWKDALATRIDLPPFSTQETEELVSRALHGRIAAPTLRRLAELAAGNALYAREIVIAAIDHGSLRPLDGVWNWDGDLVLADRLVDAVGLRLAALTAHDRQGLAVLAAGEPLALTVAESLVDPASIARMESAGLVRVDATDGTIRLAHPLYGEVILARVGILEVRALLRRLVRAMMDAPGGIAEGDLLRIAAWELESGGSPAPEHLVRAAALANRAFDYVQGERLALAARNAGAGASAEVVLARALGGRGRVEEAEAILCAAEDAVLTDPDTAVHREYLDRRIAFLHQGLGRDETALAVLDRFERIHADRASLRLTAALRSTILLDLGRIHQALDLARPLLSGEDDHALIVAAEVAGEALVYLGESESARLVHQRMHAFAASGAAESDRAVSSAGLQEIMCQLQEGELERAAVLVEAAYRAWAGGRDDVTLGLAALALGTVRMLQGRPASARSSLQEAADCLRRVDVNGTLAWVYALLAQTEAVLGEAGRARAALEQARSLRRARATARAELDFVLAEAYLEMASGNVTGAARVAADGSDGLRELPVHRARALHVGLRLGAPPGPVAEKLAGIASECSSRLPALLADHAGALAAGDAAGLEAISSRFAEFGMMLDAAEVAAQAALAHGRSDDAARTAARSSALAARCEGAVTPALRRTETTVSLSRRELEVAQLAASGLSSPEIASRLVLSARTVESHLYRVYTKLGVRRRRELAAALRTQDRSETAGGHPAQE